jgi:hypothetical protein
LVENLEGELQPGLFLEAPKVLPEESEERYSHDFLRWQFVDSEGVGNRMAQIIIVTGKPMLQRP